MGSCFSKNQLPRATQLPRSKNHSFSSSVLAVPEKQAHRPEQNAVLHRTAAELPSVVNAVTRNTLHLSDGRHVYNGSGGSAVTCLGNSYWESIYKAIQAAYEIGYIPSEFDNPFAIELCDRLVKSTGGDLAKAVLYSNGTDPVSAFMKIGRQYFVEMGQPQRQHFIYRRCSYHGANLCALDISGHPIRREMFECYMGGVTHSVSQCNSYRNLKENQTMEDYVKELAQELEDTINSVGADKVIGFICEPIVGAAQGCVPAVDGYLKAMQDVCHKYGVLFALDEVMCGFGRTGSLHAYKKHPGVKPDVLLMGKALGAGYAALSAMLVSEAIDTAIVEGSGTFMHGHTFQNLATSAAVGLEVLRIIEDNNLLANVVKQGALLKSLLTEKFEKLPNVSPPRGDGLFIGMEFHKDKATKQSFDPKLHLAFKLKDKLLENDLYLYPGMGTEDGWKGDHMIVAPPYNITEEEVRWLADKIERVYKDFFAQLEQS